jgi:hypothetical protein
MTYLTYSWYLSLTANISKIYIKTVVTAWHPPHLEHEIFKTNRDSNSDKEISAPRYISGQAWDLPHKETMSYQTSKDLCPQINIHFWAPEFNL